MDDDIVSQVMRKMGSKGGKAAAKKMTPAQRSERARKAAAASAKVRSAKAKQVKPTPQRVAYVAKFRPDKDDPNVLTVSFPDVPEAHTFGHGFDEAMTMAKGALRLGLKFYVDDGKPFPVPKAKLGRNRHLVETTPPRGYRPDRPKAAKKGAK